MNILLNTPMEVILEEEKKKVVNNIEIIQFIDKPKFKTVLAVIKFNNYVGPRTVVLWKDTEYDNIGQWTDTDAINKIKEIYNIS